jgi:voltage-gated potassium channel
MLMRRWLKAVLYFLRYPDKLLVPVIDIFSEDPIRWGTRIMMGSILGGGLLFSAVEQKANFVDGMWWAFISAMTVGYGDYSPHTPEMRIIAILVVFGGALFLIGLGSAVNARATVKRLARVAETPELHDDIGALVHGLRAYADELEEIGACLREREKRQKGQESVNRV